MVMKFRYPKVFLFNTAIILIFVQMCGRYTDCPYTYKIIRCWLALPVSEITICRGIKKIYLRSGCSTPNLSNFLPEHLVKKLIEQL